MHFIVLNVAQLHFQILFLFRNVLLKTGEGAGNYAGFASHFRLITAYPRVEFLQTVICLWNDAL